MMFKIPKRILLRDMCNYVLGFGVSRIQTNPKNVCMCIHIYIHTHTLDYITLHCIAMHCIAYHYITLHNIHNITLKKLRWYPVQPQRCTFYYFYFYKSFWSVLRNQALETPQVGFHELNGRKYRWTWSGYAQKPPRPSPEPFPQPCWTWPAFSGPCWTWPGSAPKPPGTFSGTFGTFSGTSLNLTRRLHQCTLELFLAEDPISLRCWGIT